MTNKQCRTIPHLQKKTAIASWNLARFGLELQNSRWWLEITIIAIAYFLIFWAIVNGIPKNPTTPSAFGQVQM